MCPKVPATKLLAVEEITICHFIDRHERTNLAMCAAESITDAEFYSLRTRSSTLETAPAIEKYWTTRFLY